MTKKTKKTYLCVSLCAAAFLTLGAVSTFNAAADDQVPEIVPTVEFGMDYGASVRVSEPNGLRFKVKLSDAEKAEIFAENSGKTLGMFLIPASKLGTVADYFTLTKKIDFTFSESDLYKEDGVWYANGVMTNLYLQNFNKEFVGVGYIATTVGETTTYDYADIVLQDNVRSLSDVAIEAYKDPEEEASKGVMTKLIEKAVYAAYGVAETRTTVGDEIVYEFNFGDDTWASYDAMTEDLTISLTVAKEQASLTVGDTLDLNAALAVNGTDITTLDIPFTYSAETEGVVTLEDGVISAYAAGTANITVSFGDFEKTVFITVANPADVIVDMNSAAVLNRVSAEKGAGTHKVSYSKDEKLGEDKGALQFTCLTTGDGYLQIRKPLIANVSAYDYFEFQIKNPTDHVVYVAITWVVGINIQPGETGTLKITKNDFATGNICTPTGAVMSAMDISNMRFYVKNLLKDDSIYFSSFKCGVDEIEEEYVSPANMIVDTNVVDCFNSLVIIGQSDGKSGSSHSIAYDTNVKYGDEKGSLKITSKNGGNGYLVLSNLSLLKDISQYDYIEFKIYLPKDTSLTISTAWVNTSVAKPTSDSDDVVSDSDWYTYRLDKSHFDAGSIVDPWTNAKFAATNITGTAFYIRNTATGGSIYISSIVAGKNS